MRRFLSVTLLALCASAASGCLAAMPQTGEAKHMEIKWRTSFVEAKKDAAKLDRPILFVAAAGDITGFC